MIAIRAVIIEAEVAGAIVEVGVEPGGGVAAGQLLVRLDTSEERAELAAAQAEVEIARLALMRSERLLEANLGTAEARDEARARFDAAEAVKQRIAAIIAKKSLAGAFPGHGGPARTRCRPVSRQGDEVVRLIGTEDALWVDFTLPQEEAALLERETVDIFPHGGDRDPVQGQVVARDSFVNEQSRNVRYRSRGRQAGPGPARGRDRHRGSTPGTAEDGHAGSGHGRSPGCLWRQTLRAAPGGGGRPGFRTGRSAGTLPWGRGAAN